MWWWGFACGIGTMALIGGVVGLAVWLKFAAGFMRIY